MKVFYIVLFYLSYYALLTASTLATDLPIDRKEGHVTFKLPFYDTKHRWPIQLVFDSRFLQDGGIFNNFWFFDIEDSNVVLVDKNILKWTHRHSSEIKLIKKSDGIFISNGWEAKVNNHRQIEICTKSKSRFSFLFKDGILIKEITPLEESVITYVPKSERIASVKLIREKNLLNFIYRKKGDKYLLYGIKDKDVVIEFKYADFTIYDKNGKSISMLLLSEISMPKKKISFNYTLRESNDERYNALSISYSWIDFNFSREIEWEATSGNLTRIDSRFFKVQSIHDIKEDKLNKLVITEFNGSNKLTKIWTIDYKNNMERYNIPSSDYWHETYYRNSSGYAPKVPWKRVYNKKEGKETLHYIYNDAYNLIRIHKMK